MKVTWGSIPEIPVGKANGSGHFVGKASENMNGDLRRWNFSTPFCLLNRFEYTLWWVVLPPSQILSFYISAQNFHPGGFCKWQAALDFEGL